MAGDQVNGGRIIGVTGLPCAGKSLAAGLIASGELFGKPGELIKADDVGHAVLEFPEVREELRRHFGEVIFRDPSPHAVRREIAARVFGNPEELAWLERLVHPPISRETERIIAETKKPGPAVVEAALLFTGLDRLCDRIVVVEAPFAIRLERAAKRGWSREELERRERRLLPLFGPDSLAARKEKIIVVPNDRDDARLGTRLKKAMIESGICSGKEKT